METVRRTAWSSLRFLTKAASYCIVLHRTYRETFFFLDGCFYLFFNFAKEEALKIPKASKLVWLE